MSEDSESSKNSKNLTKMTGDIILTEDKGVTKKILVEGSRDSKTLSDGMNVTVHYVGTLSDGTQFDSSRDKNTPFSFEIGAGSVIKGWDIGVKSMKIGEKSDLFCTAPYAYGEKGSGASIPPNSTLKFQIELLKADFPSITSDGQIKKEILKKGSGLDSPSSGSTCKIVYSARYGTSSPKQFIAEQSKTIIADEGVSPSGLVTALENMKAGEKSKFFISEGEHHFHPDDLPPSMDRADLLEYTIELKSFEKKKNVYEMSDDEKLSEAKVAREKGNLWFGKNRFANAEKRYEYAISCLEDIEGVFGPDSMEDPLLKSEDGENEKGESKEDEDKSNDEEESKIAEEAKKVILASLNNLAAVKIKKEKWDEVIENGEKALRIDRLNIKTLYRIAEAKAAKGQFDEAVLEIEKCFESAKISEKQRFLMKRKKMEFLRKKKESQRIVDSMYKRMSEGFGERAKK